MAPQFWILVPLLVSAISYQSGEAVSDADIQRVLVAYDPSSDHCRVISTSSSGAKAKASADKTCKEAFKALDELRYNICKGWRHAKCRLVSPGDQQYQCSCQIPHRDQSSSTNDVVIPFRDCAATLLSQELLTGAAPAPTVDTQQVESNNDEALAWVETVLRTPDQYAGSPNAGEAGGSGDGYVSSGAGPSSSVNAPHGVDTTGGVDIPLGADTQTGAFNHRLVDTATAAHTTYGVDTTSDILNQHGAGSSGDAAAPRLSTYPCTTYPSSSVATIPGPSGYKSGVADPGPSWYPSTVHPPSSGVAIPCLFGNPGSTYPSYTPELHNIWMALDQAKHSLPFSCPHCTKPFKTLLEMGDHMKAHPPVTGGPSFRQPIPGPHQCSQCGKSYSLKRVLQAHEKSHGTMETYCIFCNEVLGTKGSYKSHMRARHPDLAADGSAAAKSGPRVRGPETGRLPCSGCGKTFAHKKALQAHERTHKTLETHCLYCDRTFSSWNGHKKHMQRRHPLLASVQKEAAREKREAALTERCEICGKGFKKGKGLKDHKKVHEGATKCPECGGTFSRVSGLKEHRKNVHKVRDP